MTTPRDDIAGLSERLRRLARITRRAIETSKLVFPWTTDSKTLDEAATQLDSLLKEREALQARVKELEEENGILRDMLLNPDPDIEPDNLRLHREKCDAIDRALVAESRALRLQQERDEAYERAAIYIEQREGLIPDWRGFVAELRGLAGPEKEGK